MQKPDAGMPIAGSYQRRLPRLDWFAAAAWAVAIAALIAPGARAEEDQYDRARAQHPELFKVYYDENVLEYCGLLTHESALGFTLQRDDLLALRPLTDNDVRDVRIAGAIAADMAYGAHGLAQSAW